MNTLAMVIGWIVMGAAGLAAAVALLCWACWWTFDRLINYHGVAVAFVEARMKQARAREARTSNAALTGQQKPEKGKAS